MFRTGMMFFSCVSAALLVANPARATEVNDPSGDFLPTYTGPFDADLDVTSFGVSYNPAISSFTLNATFSGAIDVTKAGFYVIGANTGVPTSNFASVGAGGVVFNRVILIQKDGSAAIGGGAALPNGSVSISGNSFSALVPLSLLPSTGFDPINYGFNLWPRKGGIVGTAAISDFAPNNATISAAPEPATWSLMILGFGAAGATIRRGRKRVITAYV